MPIDLEFPIFSMLIDLGFPSCDRKCFEPYNSLVIPRSPGPVSAAKALLVDDDNYDSHWIGVN